MEKNFIAFALAIGLLVVGCGTPINQPHFFGDGTGGYVKYSNGTILAPTMPNKVLVVNATREYILVVERDGQVLDPYLPPGETFTYGAYVWAQDRPETIVVKVCLLNQGGRYVIVKSFTQQVIMFHRGRWNTTFTVTNSDNTWLSGGNQDVYLNMSGPYGTSW